MTSRTKGAIFALLTEHAEGIKYELDFIRELVVMGFTKILTSEEKDVIFRAIHQSLESLYSKIK